MGGPNQAVSRAGPVNKSPGAGGGGETNPLHYGRRVFHRACEGVPVVGHGLREFQKFRGQVLGPIKLDAQLAGPQFDPVGQFAHGHVAHVSRGRNAHAAAGELAAGAVEILDEPGAPGGLPLKAFTGRDRF